MLIANATGCSSIYGGNLPTTPWSANGEGRGPAWSNSLFEDNAEFGYGMRVALDQQRQMALDLLGRLAGSLAGDQLPPPLVDGLRDADQGDEAGIAEQRQRVAELKRRLEAVLQMADGLPVASGGAADDQVRAQIHQLLELADALVKKSVWLVGGDGWAYDIGFGGLDHVLAAGRDVNALVLDTEVYSNTGGQASKATPLGAVAKFAASGKPAGKKDLGLMAMTYGHIYVASVAMGARDEHMAYSHCIAHGIDMAQGMAHQKLAVDTGRWLLYRFDPRRAERGENPLQLDSPPPRRKLEEGMAAENRFRMLRYSQPERARELAQAAQAELDRRWAAYRALAGQSAGGGTEPGGAS